MTVFCYSVTLTIWQIGVYIVATYTLNISKCMFVRFGLVNKPSKPSDCYFSGTVLQKVLSTKDLGIIFDSKMAFSERCHALANEGFSRLYLLLRRFQSRERELQIKLFNFFADLVNSFKARNQNY